MHDEKHQRRITATGSKDKTVVMGILERGGEVRATVFPLAASALQARDSPPRQGAAPRSTLMQSRVLRYAQASELQTRVVDHAERYVDGRIHTNGLENFWSLTKRQLKGTYISVEPFHLFRYLDEQVYRYNNRGNKENPVNDGERFQKALSQIAGKRLTFAEVTGKVSPTPN